MVSLLDVNVLVALLVPEHEHHHLAVDWFAREAVTDGWATCAVTELGVIRVCAQLAGGRRAADATADRLLLLTVSNRAHAWWPDIASPALLAEVTCGNYRQAGDRRLSAGPGSAPRRAPSSPSTVR